MPTLTLLQKPNCILSEGAWKWQEMSRTPGQAEYQPLRSKNSFICLTQVPILALAGLQETLFLVGQWPSTPRSKFTAHRLRERLKWLSGECLC